MHYNINDWFLSTLRIVNKSLKFLFVAFLLFSCNDEEKISDEALAKKYCTSCHSFPQPQLLDKHSWKDGVLPRMAVKLGIAYYNGNYATALSKTVDKYNNNPAI